jgi:rubredoxin
MANNPSPPLPPEGFRPSETQSPSPDTFRTREPYPLPAPAPARPGPVPASATVRDQPTPAEVKDGTREIIETIVFVVVLVLLLKTFLAEAFVIPTGSMATTLLGYHKDVTCEQCGFTWTVNASNEVEDEPPGRVVEWTCPNCRFANRLLPRPEAREP